MLNYQSLWRETTFLNLPIYKKHCTHHQHALHALVFSRFFQMTVILWHLLGTVIQCEPERMKEVRAATATVFSSSNNNNKRMLEATISTNKFDNE
jgi:hypothetical protein